MSMSFNWRLNNESGTIIHTNGNISGSGESIYFEVPKNIMDSIRSNPNNDPSMYTWMTPGQKMSMRSVVSGLGKDEVFSKSSAANLYEIAISMYMGSR